MDEKLVKADSTSNFEVADNQNDLEKSSVHNYGTEISNNSPNSSAIRNFKENPDMESLTGDSTLKDGVSEKSSETQNEDKNISNSEMPQSTNGKEKFVDEICFNFVKETGVKDTLNSNVVSTDSTKGDQEETDDDDDDTTCGIGSFRPQWIQKFATPRTYLILYSILGVLQGSYYTYFIGTLSTVEKRFAFKSKVSGTIMIVDEISPLVLGVLVGYFGGKAHRIRLIAIGMFLSTLCCFVSAFPYFIYGAAQHLTSLGGLKQSDQELCNSYSGLDPCDSDDRPPTISAILLFILAHFLKGFGNTAYYTVGLSYMDDNARKKNTPMYFAVTFALRLLGPLLGFLMSSAFLKVYENPFVDPGFGPDDPRWIGAWWIGFCLQGVLLSIVTFPIFLFPRRLSKHDKSKAKKAEEKEKLLPLILGFFRTMKRVCKNPVFFLIVVNATLEIGSFGHYVMLPKYMENQFRLTASDSNLYSGPPGIVAVMASVIIGGFLMWKFRPNVKIILMGMVTTQVLSAIGYLILTIPQCEKVEMSNFGQNEKGLILEGSCNMNCSCTQSAFTPVCGPDGKTTYFTPCYAGCGASLSESSSFSGKKEFFDCSCVTDSSKEQNIEVTEGFCVAEGCWSQALIYIILFPILQMIASLLRVSHTILLLRSVHPRDKSAALGAMESLISLLGFLPYLVVFGTLVDSSCLVWEEKCGETGNCWFYDMDSFSYLLHGSSSICALLSALCCLTIYFLSARIRDLYNDDVDDEDCKATELSEVDKTTNSNTKI